MDKKYQIFISSTFVDLAEERQNVIKSVLLLEHMPAGMELFPATDDSSWDLIKDVIDASDYYLLIIGGRYGSTDKEGIGYTEKEYDYAVSQNKPVIPLLHKEPDAIPVGKTDKDEELSKKLTEFRKKVGSKHNCVFWTDTDSLRAEVVTSLVQTMKRKPAIGWVRADQVPEESALKEILQLKNTVADLENKLQKSDLKIIKDFDDLSQGEDSFEIDLSLTYRGKTYDSKVYHSMAIEVTWNHIFINLGPILLNEAKDKEVKDKINWYVKAVAAHHSENPYKGQTVLSLSLAEHYVDTIIIQLRALGLIVESIKKRSIKDTNTYWTLTTMGDELLVRLRALKKNDISKENAT